MRRIIFSVEDLAITQPYWLIPIAAALVVKTSIAQPCVERWLPGEEIPGVEMTVYASTVWDEDGPGGAVPRLVLAGAPFIGPGIPVQVVMVWDGVSWSPLQDGLPLAGTSFSALAVYDGELIAGGSISFDGNSLGNIAKWNGNQWERLGGGVDGRVAAFHIFGGELHVGGSFTVTSQGPARGLASWDGSNWRNSSGNINGSVASIANYDDKLFIGGQFRVNDDSIPFRIARLDPGGWVDISGFLDGGVGVLNTYDGRLVAGGDFQSIGGLPVGGVAAWDGVSWSSLGVGMASPRVRTLQVFEGQLYAGGRFNFAGGQLARNIARWNGASWSSVGSGIVASSASAEDFVFSLTTYQDELVVSGAFLKAGPANVRRVARWNRQTWLGIGPGFCGPVHAFAVHGGELFAGGTFTTAGSSDALRIARFDGTDWAPLGAGLASESSTPQLNGLASFGPDLAAVGRFATAGGVAANSVAFWDGSEWRSAGLGLEGTAYACAEFENQLIVGGLFENAGGEEVSNIAAWDGAAWLPMSSGMNDTVFALTVHNGELYAGGIFAVAGGTSARRIARWDGAAWRRLGTGFNNRVLALASYGGSLIAGGDFTTAGGLPISTIAAWDGATWRSVGGGFDREITALGTHRGDLIAGGQFDVAGGVPARKIARWNGGSWSAMGEGLEDFSLEVGPQAFASFCGELVVGGDFSVAGGQDSAFLAKWRACASSILGDMNCDGAVSVGDVRGFVIALTDDDGYCVAYPTCFIENADVNGDGFVSVGDIAGFVALVAGSTDSDEN